jgi:hypothetical protein
MSRLDNPLSEIPAGTHLVVILEASILRDSEKLPVIAKDGSNGIKIRFNDNKLNHDKVFWTKSSDFKKLCSATESDMKKPICPELRGKRLWMCVKEIRLMAEDKHVSSTFESFDYLQYIPQMTKPIISGDPCQHPKGEPLGVFVEYVQSQETQAEAFINHPLVEDVMEEKSKEMFNDLFVTGKASSKLSPEQEKKLAIAKEIIAKGEANKDLTSLNEKNNPPKEEQAKHDEISENDGLDIFAEEPKTPIEPLDDWGDL